MLNVDNIIWITNRGRHVVVKYILWNGNSVSYI